MGDAKHTPGPWVAANMVHAERGGAMTPDEIGLYVANSVRKTIDDGGSPERFLFITGTEDGGPDICLVGNGPRGPENARLIASAPDLLEALKRLLGATDAGNAETHDLGCRCVIHEARAAISRATR